MAKITRLYCGEGVRGRNSCVYHRKGRREMNERMTKRDTDGQAMMDCQKCEADWTGKHGKPMVDCTALYCRKCFAGNGG